MTPVLYPAISDAGYPQMYCREHGIRFRLIRLFGMTEPKMGQYNTSEKQYEILLTALEMRYFVVPAETTVEEIATELGISTTTASERLQRHRRTS